MSLSAILHSSEDILAATTSDVDNAAIREAFEIIEICISHQRNTVDDVLSLFKLDALILSQAK